MSRRNVRVTDAEFALLEPLWSAGPQTIRQLTAELYPAQSTSDYATVQKLLERLEAKECVARDRAQTPHVFRATVARTDLIEDQLKQIADRLCDGSLVPVLNQLVERMALTKSQRAHLQKLFDDHFPARRGKTPPDKKPRRGKGPRT